MRIRLPAFFEKHPPVRALLPGYEINPIVRQGEFLDVRQAVRHLAANRVVVIKLDTRLQPLLNLGDDGAETVQRFGCLRKEADIAGEIQTVQIIRLFHDNPHEVITVKDMQAKFSITPTTAKSDITGLVKRGILEEIALNKVKRGYIKGAAFDKLTENRKGK